MNPQLRIKRCLVAAAILAATAISLFAFSDRHAMAALWTNLSDYALHVVIQIKGNLASLMGATISGGALVLIAVVGLQIGKRILRARDQPFSPTTALLSDSPIDSKSDDKFGYEVIAEKLQKYVCLASNSPSLVIALNDRWGTGKTSTLNLLKQKLGNHAGDPIVVEFSPWLVGTKEGLTQHFLAHLAASIESECGTDSESEAREACRKLLEMAEHLPDVGNWASLASAASRGLFGTRSQAKSTADEGTLLEHKVRVSRSLSRLRRPIVVLVDDIDRLTSPEVLATMQMVKAVCDFRGVCYLLALDQSRVAERIASICGGDGFDYLEKIIQAEVRLPPTTFRRRQAHLKNLVLQAIQINKVKFTGGDNDSSLEDALWILSRIITTPRDATRFINRLILNGIHKEVYLPDRLIYEGLAMKHSSIVSEIRRFPAKFASLDIPAAALGLSLSEQIVESSDKSKPTSEKYLEELLANTPLESKDTINRALTFLFPRFNSSSFGRTSHERSARLLDRAAHYPTLLRLIDVAESNTNFSSQDATLFLTSPPQRAAILTAHVLENREDDFLIYLKTFIQEYGVRDPEAMAKDLLSFGAAAFKGHSLDLSRDIASLILALMISKRALENPLAFILEVMSNPDCLSSTETIALELAREAGLWHDGVYTPPNSEESTRTTYGLSPIQISSALTTWISTVESESTRRSFFFSEPEPISILYRWAQFGRNTAPPQKYVDQLMQSQTGVEAFLTHYEGAASVKNIEDLVTNLPFLLEQARLLRERFPTSFKKLAEYIPAYLSRKNKGDESHP